MIDDARVVLAVRAHRWKATLTAYKEWVTEDGTRIIAEDHEWRPR